MELLPHCTLGQVWVMKKGNQISIKKEETCKMVEDKDVEITFLPTNTARIHLLVDQRLQNNY